MKSSSVQNKWFLLRIELLDLHRPVWREIVVPSSISLFWLHQVIQEAMGWEEIHLHEFECNGRRFSSNDSENLFETVGAVSEDEAQVSLSELLRRPKDHLLYAYDFGDGWCHSVTLKKELSASTEPSIKCIEGLGACPPEDCGGPPGFERICRAIDGRPGAMPTAERDEILDWIGGDFDPSFFDMEEIELGLEEIWDLHEEEPRGLGPAQEKSEDDLYREEVFQEYFEGSSRDESVIDLFGESPVDDYGTEEPPHPYENLSDGELSSYAELLEIGERIRALEPWKDLWDNDLFSFEDPDTETPCIVSVLGAGKEVFAIHVYRAPEGVEFWKRAFTGVMPTSVEEYQKSLNLAELQFVKKAELEGPDLDLYRLVSHPEPPRGRNRWLKFFDYHPRKMPWFLPLSETALLKMGLLLCERYVHILRSVPKSKRPALLRPEVEELGRDLPETLPTFQLQAGASAEKVENWDLSQKAFDWDAEDSDLQNDFMVGEFALQRIGLLPEVDEVWEVGAVYLSNPVMTDFGPVTPIIALAVPVVPGSEPPNPHMESNPKVTPAQVVWECFEAACVERECRPSLIRVTTDIGERTFKPFEVYCSTRVEKAEDFELIGSLLQSLANF